ncbi:hypothetical protein ACN28E_40205 [Archangium lansingense]|uniref:hypothetical protein n=1 Tax=Archangium lansingense TaxID=2995310 RepID=UPI003B7995EA
MSEIRPLYYAIGRLARSSAGLKVMSDTARDFMERINRETVDSAPLYERASEHCQLNDCSTESPR